MSTTRYAVIGGTQDIAHYLPADYRVIGPVVDNGLDCMLIAGEDDHGWTLDAYVLPRLASGLHGGHEVGEQEGVVMAVDASRRLARQATCEHHHLDRLRTSLYQCDDCAMKLSVALSAAR